MQNIEGKKKKKREKMYFLKKIFVYVKKML